MATIKSIFGVYADAANMQLMIDRQLDTFAPVDFTKDMNWGTPSPNLTYESAIGRSRIEAAASIADRSSPAPLRTRQALDKLSGKVPAIKEKISLDEDQFRSYMTIQQMQVSDEVKKKQLLDLLFGDVQLVGNSAMKRLDYMYKEGLSTGSITLTVTNNPDALVAPTAIDLLLSDSNRKNSTVSWDAEDKTTTKPITDIAAVVEDAAGRGIVFEKIRVTRVTWLNFIKSKEVIDSLTGFQGLAKGTITPTLAQVNEFLASNLYPVIEIVTNNKIGIEKDGKITVQQPFIDASAVFTPPGKLGEIKLAMAMGEMKPVPQLSYAKFNNALISKWADNDPWIEYTAVELNAFPAFDAIDQIYILTANH
ncbi:MAG TPA: major capsid protein [Puia sp.]|jgi:hypothetical protein